MEELVERKTTVDCLDKLKTTVFLEQHKTTIHLVDLAKPKIIYLETLSHSGGTTSLGTTFHKQTPNQTNS